MRAIFLLLAAVLWCGNTHAAVPQTINYQGYLANAAGTPVNGAVEMTFRLYDTASGGSALWTETQRSVTVERGTFSTVLGSETPLPPLPFDVPYWLSVAINADPEMTPRQAVNASPYAIRAATADALAPGAAVGTVTSIATGNGLSGGPITAAGTIDLKLNTAGGLSKTLGAGSNELGVAPGGVAPAHLSAAGSVSGQALVSTGAGVAWGSPALPLRKYYLTQAHFAGNEALAACAAGYHMATLMEIFNFNLLQYDTVLGLNGADSGAGGMRPGVSGWIRTGNISFVLNIPGQANCSLWTSNQHADYGTQVSFISNWGTSPVPMYVSPWYGSVQWCDFPGPVWCVQD